jgi:hypothetical protein
MKASCMKTCANVKCKTILRALLNVTHPSLYSCQVSDRCSCSLKLCLFSYYSCLHLRPDFTVKESISLFFLTVSYFETISIPFKRICRIISKFALKKYHRFLRAKHPGMRRSNSKIFFGVRISQGHVNVMVNFMVV